MTNKYLKPMLDVGSPRVFNCNEMTKRVMAQKPDAKPFFRSKQLNTIVLVKDTVPEVDRQQGAPFVGTKLYFPFNEKNIYEGGRTIFLHDKLLEPSIMAHYGESAIPKDKLEEDLKIMRILDRLPSLDPFLMKDIFLRYKIPMDEAFFEVSEEAWNEIESFMLQRFEPLVRAAFPDEDTAADDNRARQLIDKIWEARDIDALQPLITAFRLPQQGALDIFSSWRGIVYYSFQYQKEQVKLVDLIKWLKENEAPAAGVPAAENKEMLTMMAFIKDQIRKEWQTIEEIVKAYQSSYDKMFRDKISSADFLAFLRGSNETYWKIGNSLGKTNHAIYCWDVMSSRFKDRKLPWVQRQEMAKLLMTIFQQEKKTTTNMAW